jgi:hypothetical protein
MPCAVETCSCLPFTLKRVVCRCASSLWRALWTKQGRLREDYANSLVFSGKTPLTVPRIQPKTGGERRKQREMCRRKKVEDLEESKNGRTVGRQDEMDKRITRK